MPLQAHVYQTRHMLMLQFHKSQSCDSAHGCARNNTEAANTSCQSLGHVPNGPLNAVGTSGIHWTLEARPVASRNIQTQALFKCLQMSAWEGKQVLIVCAAKATPAAVTQASMSHIVSHIHVTYCVTYSCVPWLGQDCACILYTSFACSFGVFCTKHKLGCQGSTYDVAKNACIGSTQLSHTYNTQDVSKSQPTCSSAKLRHECLFLC